MVAFLLSVISVLFTGIWKNFGLHSANSSFNTNVNSTDRSHAFIGIFLIKEDESQCVKEKEHFHIAQTFIVQNMTKTLEYALTAMSELTVFSFGLKINLDL